MRSRWIEAIGIVWTLGGPIPTAAQARELGFQALGTSSDPALVVAGPTAALRLSERTRLALSFGVGISDNEVAGRGEAMGHFLLSPGKRHGWGAYLAGGLAAVEGTVHRGYLVLAIGWEERPRGRSGWALEAGAGGGLRVSAGYRWRWFPTSVP